MVINLVVNVKLKKVWKRFEAMVLTISVLHFPQVISFGSKLL